MKAKKLLTGLSIAICLAVPASVFAATSDTTAARSVRSFFGIDVSKLTTQQKGDLDSYTKKMADVQKEMLNKMAANGSMTKEQADAEIKRIDEAIKNGFYSQGIWGTGPRGMKGKFGGMFGIDLSKMTDQQKADFKVIYEKIGTLQKSNITKQVENGMLTKDQGAVAIKEVDECIASGDFMKMFGRGGFGMFGKFRMDSSNLTDKQKADMDEFQTQLKVLQKELINKAVSNGAITKDQGDAAIKQIDNPQIGMDGGFPGGHGKGMGRGRGMGRGFDEGQQQNDSQTQNQSNASSTSL